MKFVPCNVNPKNRQTDDSIIRAISTATNKSWYDIFENLARFAMKLGLTMTDKRILKKYLRYLGYQEQPVPKKVDNSRYTVSDFCERLAKPNETYLLSISNNLTCVINKDLYDTYNCSHKTVSNYWLVK